MFKKRICQKCGKKISEKYRFCPHCGSTDNNFEEEGWGMLGKDDVITSNNFQLPSGFNMIFNSLMKNLNKQLNGMYNEPVKNSNMGIKKDGISISISTMGNNPAKIKVNSFDNQKKQIKKIPGQFSKESSKRFAELPKKEPKTNIRRLSNKVVYEIEIPDVKSLKDISIIKLESSIEIKAIGENKAYFKRIPINFPIINYIFSGEKLILEFGIKN
ncbi:zinc-ribbon domain-containing protein [Candidatus Pacearchaeota archaeon]|nr:zinc-ribbon domain-containing protein [Candidatus Pacearchaeota archaeon]